MNRLHSFFGKAASEVFEIYPDMSWPQSAPTLDNKILFDQRHKPESKVQGVLLLSKSSDIDGLQLTYRMQDAMRGFILRDRIIEMYPFNQLVLADRSEGPELFVTHDDVVLPHSLDSDDIRTVSSLFATAALAKFHEVKNANDHQMAEELQRMIG